MLLSQAVNLIQHPTSQQKSIWADLGCGTGLFTNALSQIIAEQSIIYAVDKNKLSLNKVSVKSGIELKKTALNFISDELPFNNLSGIMMANSFHFVKDKITFINKASGCLDANGYFIMIEYDTDISNFWVPYPISFNQLQKFFTQYNCIAEKLQEIPSRYNGIIYSALIKKISKA